jgi:hypothetical protein
MKYRCTWMHILHLVQKGSSIIIDLTVRTRNHFLETGIENWIIDWN